MGAVNTCRSTGVQAGSPIRATFTSDAVRAVVAWATAASINDARMSNPRRQAYATVKLVSLLNRPHDDRFLNSCSAVSRSPDVIPSPTAISLNGTQPL